MRWQNKFKFFDNMLTVIKKVPLRALKFNRPKWFGLKKKLKFLKNRYFVDSKLKKVSVKSVPRVSNYARYELTRKRNYLALFRTHREVNFNLTKNTVNILQKNLGAKLFTLATLIWHLKFTRSYFQSVQQIHFGNVLVNSVKGFPECILNKGDVVHFRSPVKNSFFSFNENSYVVDDSLLTFVEIDYYSNTFVIVKDLKELDFDDFKTLRDSDVNIDFTK